MGSGLLGFTVNIAYVPCLSDIVHAITESEGIPEDDQKLNDLASGLVNSAYAFGSIFAPILGGFFNDRVGFRLTCDIFAMLTLVYCLIYFLVNVLPHIMKKKALITLK